MSIDTFVHIKEVEPGVYSVIYGTLSAEGTDDRELLRTSDLRDAILRAQEEELEYGLSFGFMPIAEPRSVHTQIQTACLGVSLDPLRARPQVDA